MKLLKQKYKKERKLTTRHPLGRANGALASLLESSGQPQWYLGNNLGRKWAKISLPLLINKKRLCTYVISKKNQGRGVQIIAYRNEIESTHFEIGYNVHDLIFSNELKLSERQNNNILI